MIQLERIAIQELSKLLSQLEPLLVETVKVTSCIGNLTESNAVYTKVGQLEYNCRNLLQRVRTTQNCAESLAKEIANE